MLEPGDSGFNRFSGQFREELGDPVLSRSGQDVERDLAMSLFLSNFVHYFKQSEELPLERRRDSV